jgi:arsenite-transporting ATPase
MLNTFSADSNDARGHERNHREAQVPFLRREGRVGKTTMAATTATWLSDHGYKTLIVATDPTVSLSAIYGQEIRPPTSPR